MKASTLFAITVAVLLALSAAVGARMMGLFNPTPKAQAQEPVIKVLVARANLYEGVAILPDMVRVRDLRQDELDFYNNNKSKFLPANIEASTFRVPTRNIEADQPILRTDLQDLAYPEGVPLRLTPGMRAVNLSLPKDRTAGGLIAKGDYVDVLLTSQVCDGNDCKNGRILSAFIARGLKVIVKRNSLWTVLRANPDNVPVSYTLEANPYRAALIEFASNKGIITLLPSSAQRKARTEMVVPVSADTTPGSFSIPDSPEYRDEDERVDRLLKGEHSISDADLERIFHLRPILRTPPPIVIQRISGTQLSGQSSFPADPNDTPRASTNSTLDKPLVAGMTPWMGYTFRAPNVTATNSGATDCPTCNKKQ